jgi:thiamine-monophosphate kinase
MIDISDGLSSDLHHVCAQSHVGAVILEEQIPIDAGTERIADSCQCSALEFALSGGEDFELLFTVSPQGADRCMRDGRATVIGEIVARSGGVTLRRRNGTVECIPRSGYQHFSKEDVVETLQRTQ